MNYCGTAITCSYSDANALLNRILTCGMSRSVKRVPGMVRVRGGVPGDNDCAGLSMNDIGEIGSNVDYRSIQVLPSALDRIRAVDYHCNLMVTHCSQRDFDHARWQFRGALSEFKSIFDVVKSDFKNLGLIRAWKEDNPFSRNIENSPLIKILRRVKDFAVHTVSVTGDARNFNYVSARAGGQKKSSRSLMFIRPVSRKQASHELPRTVSTDELLWFNRQVELWPAHLLLQEGVFLVYVEFRNFLIATRKI